MAPAAQPSAHPEYTGELTASERYLASARKGWRRVSAAEAHAEQQADAIIIDTRTHEQRQRSELIPGAICIDRTVLEWRLDPTFAWRIPEATSWDQRYIIVCRHGYSSSVAVKNLRELGLTNVTDIEGGYDAWERAGLPRTSGPADVRE